MKSSLSANPTRKVLRRRRNSHFFLRSHTKGLVDPSKMIFNDSANSNLPLYRGESEKDPKRGSGTIMCVILMVFDGLFFFSFAFFLQREKSFQLRFSRSIRRSGLYRFLLLCCSSYAVTVPTEKLLIRKYLRNSIRLRINYESFCNDCKRLEFR